MLQFPLKLFSNTCLYLYIYMCLCAYYFRIMKNLPETAGSSYSAAVGLALWETPALHCGIIVLLPSRTSLRSTTVNTFFKEIGSFS